MSCIAANLDIEQGVSVVVRYKLTDSVGAPLDLTGATIESKIREQLQPGSPLILDLEPFFTILAPATDGIVELHIPGATTTTYVQTNGSITPPYDAIITLASGKSKKFAGGLAVSQYTATALT